MLLSQFIQTCWQQGRVTVANELIDFSDEDKQQTVDALMQFYAQDALEQSGQVPPFNQNAALWAAIYLYRAVQFTLLRDKGAETVNEQLTPFNGTINAEAVYSVDLCFRYLPHLFNLARGLAPGDVLVQHLLQSAAQWPLSSVGMPANVENNLQVILNNDCLCRLYVDRIIEKRDVKRSTHALVNERVQESLGIYHHELWPGFAPLTIEK